MSKPPRRRTRVEQLLQERMEEHSDSQLDRSSHLRIDDLFNDIGEWNALYVRVMVLNGLVFGLCSMHQQLLYMYSTTEEDYRFEDPKGVSYDELNGTVLIESKKYGGNNAVLRTSALELLFNFGRLFGIFLSLILARKQPTTLVSGGMAAYVIVVLSVFIDYLPLIKIAVLIATAAVEVCRLGALMACFESIPSHTRPLGMLVMQTLDSVMCLICMGILRMLTEFRYMTITATIMFAVVGVFYYFLCPSSIHRLLLAGEGMKLQAELNLWRPDKKLLDVEDVIDDVVYGDHVTHVTVTHKEGLSHLFKIKLFRRKLWIILFLLPLASILQTANNTFQRELMYWSLLEGQLFRHVCLLLAGFLTCALLYKFGRRGTSITFCLLGVLGLTAGILTPMEVYNVCKQRVQPGASLWWLTTTSYIACAVAARMGGYTTRLMIVEHIPSRSRPILLPLSFLAAEIVRLVYDSFIHTALTAESVDTHPALYLLPPYFFCMVALILVVLYFDNSGYMAVTPDELSCYYLPRDTYPDANGDASEMSSSS